MQATQVAREVAIGVVLAVLPAAAVTALGVLLGDHHPLASFLGVAAVLFALRARFPGL
jgi:hypothetical protein